MRREEVGDLQVNTVYATLPRPTVKEAVHLGTAVKYYMSTTTSDSINRADLDDTGRSVEPTLKREVLPAGLL